MYNKLKIIATIVCFFIVNCNNLYCQLTVIPKIICNDTLILSVINKSDSTIYLLNDRWKFDFDYCNNNMFDPLYITENSIINQVALNKKLKSVLNEPRNYEENNHNTHTLSLLYPNDTINIIMKLSTKLDSNCFKHNDTLELSVKLFYYDKTPFNNITVHNNNLYLLNSTIDVFFPFDKGMKNSKNKMMKNIYAYFFIIKNKNNYKILPNNKNN